MGIPVDEWTPWVGEKLAVGWETALEHLSMIHPADRQLIVSYMLDESKLAQITCVQILQKAVRAGYLRVSQPYDAVRKAGPFLLINDKCDDKVFARWNERPVRTETAKKKKRRFIDKQEARHNPLERKYGG